MNAIVSNDSTSKEKTIPTEQYKLFNTLEEKELSLKKWNEAAIDNAQLFLLQLNDFEKALPIYRKIIE